MTEDSGSMANRPDTSASSRKRVFVRSALIAVGLQWSLRLIGLISIFVLARILTPADFGILGLAITAVAFVEIFSFLGLRQALLRIDEPTSAQLDTAWTIQLMLFTALAAVLVLIAPAVATFYSEPALTAVLTVLSARFVLTGLVNIGIVDFDRHFQFGRDMRLRLVTRLGSFAVTVALALLLRSYWALIIGLIAQSVFFTLGSYLAHPHRPRLNLSRRKELLGVSFWMFLGMAAQVAQHQLERIAIGRMFSASTVGLYSVSKDLSSIFTQEIATALNRVSFVATARAHDTRSHLSEGLATMLGAYALIVAPMGLGLSAVAPSALASLLGSQWVAATELLAIVAPAAAVYAVYKLVASTLQAAGYAKRSALLTSSGTAISAILIAVAAVSVGTAQAVAIAALAASVFILAAGSIAVARLADQRAAGLQWAILRPFIAAGLMWGGLTAIEIPTGSVFADLGLRIVIGALIYVASLLALWISVGRPRGAEEEALKLLGPACPAWLVPDTIR